MKYLIVYASAGAGHRKAAEAIHEALLERVDKKDVAIIDSLDYTNAFFRWIYARKYITFVNDLPNIWGFFYYLLNIRLIYRLIRFPGAGLINQAVRQLVCKWPFNRHA